MARNQFWNTVGWVGFFGANVGLGVAAYNTFERVETLRGRGDQYVAADPADWGLDRAKMLFHFVTEIDEAVKFALHPFNNDNPVESGMAVAWTEIVFSALSTEAVVACRRAFRK